MAKTKKKSSKIKYNKYQLFFLKNSKNIKLSLFLAAYILFGIGIINSPNIDTGLGNYHVELNDGFVINPNETTIEINKPTYHVSMKVAAEGYDIYAPASNTSGYRYGPSLMKNEDGSIDAWFSSPGNNRTEWDWITYKHSEDGINWSNEKIVLQPTGNSMDHYSICDPGLVYFNGYYYLGYTSTIVSTDGGINNNVFVARSKNPDGPYEKWNGNGWGGKPEPIIYYNESNAGWGAGEISFVVVDNKLYCYYSWYCEHGYYTKLSTADLSDNWPASLTYQGIVLDKKWGIDSCDVVYLEDYNKFLIFSVSNRLSKDSGIVIYESDDGINFNEADTIYTNVCMYAHNLGITKDKIGHINIKDELAISYAYSSNENVRGRWPTRFQNIDLIVYESDEFIKQDKNGMPTFRGNYSLTKTPAKTVGLSFNNRYVNINLDESYRLVPYLYNEYRGAYPISNGVTYEYDNSIIDIENNVVIPKKTGETVVYAYCGDFYSTITVNVNEEGFNKNIINPKITKFEPRESIVTLHIEDKNYHNVQIRGLVEFENGDWGEAYNDYTIEHPKYPAKVNASIYPMKYEIEDPSIVYVSDKGIMHPLRVGKTIIKVTIADDLYFFVLVNVEF